LHLLLFKVDSAQANYTAAIAHYQHFKALTDSIFNHVKSEQIASLQIQHDTKKKEQNIALLLQQSQAQQARIRQREMQRNAIIAGAIVLLFLSGVIYNQYLVKQRSNEQLQAQQKEISLKNHSLQQLLEEKEWLLKEVHHRVKNNLHTIISLLESQSAYLQNDALQAIKDSQHRVFAMSLIHQKLYQATNVASIDMSIYLQELIHYLRESFNTRQRVRFQVQIERIELDAARAIPMGLILNEAVTNALKHAFPNDRAGLILLSLTRQAESQFLLSVADNGIGLPAGFDSVRTNSLGMKLMKGLSREINAQLSIESKEGTLIQVAFTATQSLHETQQSTVSTKMVLSV
jgi:two-component sensor histidine kinase